MSCIQCEDALIKGLNKCPRCGEILKKEIENTEIIEEMMAEEIDSVEDELDRKEELIEEAEQAKEDIEDEVDITDEEIKDYEEYTKRLRLYTMIAGLIGISFLIFVFYIIFK